MSLAPGTSIGHYDVTSLLGEGGMGQVWQATDTQLNRQVALKILPDAFAADPDRLARFKREAQILASLNHPNIAAIYGIEEAEGTRALVLELVEGPTLADRIAKGPIPLDEALPIAKQIAEALEAAHEQGVIHRDLKPANVKVKDDGTVKVLDFGLAKAFQPDASDPNLSMSPTISLTAAATQMGMVIGTAAYMAPEQAKGKVVDKRADVWAFGAVLFEMLTGAKPFPGADVSDTLATVLKFDPDWDLLPARTPESLRRLMRRCLTKDQKRRLGDMRSAVLDLDDAGLSVDHDERTTAVSRHLVWWKQPPAIGVVIGAALVTGAAVWMLARPTVAPGDVVRFEIVPPDDQYLSFGGQARDVVISPDGTKIVYKGPIPTTAASGPQLYLRSVDQLDGGPLPGTQGALGQFVSPDSQWVGFTDQSGRVLQRVPILGGSPVTVAEADSRIFGASWGRDGDIVFGTEGGGLFRVPAAGGEPESLTTLEPEHGDGEHLWPTLIEEASAVVFVINAAGETPPLASGRLAVLDLDTQAMTRLDIVGASPQYVSTGHIVYGAEDGSVRAVPFDTVTLEVTGVPVSLITGVRVKRSGSAAFSVSDGGRLVYALDTGVNTARRSLVWVDETGREERIPAPPRMYADPRLSPDGTKVALTMREEDGSTAIWIWHLYTEVLTRLTFGTGNDSSGYWTPDGRRVVFSSGRTFGGRTTYEKAADGSGTATLVPASVLGEVVAAVVPDGNAVVARVTAAANASSGSDLVLVPLGAAGVREPLLSTEFDERNPAVSPDGAWLAYVSNISGQYEVYVRPFPNVDDGLWQVSTDGGRAPTWSADGDELFFVEDDRRMMATSIRTSPGFSRTTPRMLFDGDYLTSRNARQYDVARDGRFVMIEASSAPDQEAQLPRITVVLNWFEELKRLVPTN